MIKKALPYGILIIFFALNIYDLRQTYPFLHSDGKLTSSLVGPFPYNVVSVISEFSQYYSIDFIGFVFVFIGAYCYIQKPNSAVIVNFFYLMSVTGFAISFSYSSNLGLSPGKEIERLSVSFISYFLIRFFEYYPVSNRSKSFHKIKNTNLSLAIAFNIIHFTSMIFHWNEDIVSQFIRSGIIINMFLSIIICIYIIQKYLKSNSRRVKNQLNFLIASLIISFGPTLLLSRIPDIFFQLKVIPYYFSINSIIIFPISVAYLLIKQEIIDFNIHAKKLFYKLLSILFTVILINLLISLFINLSLKEIIQFNLSIISSLVVFDKIQNLFKPIQMKEWEEKNHKIQREKNFIFQQILNGSHLSTCAEYIINLIHKVIDINGVCIILEREGTDIVLNRSGIFNDSRKTDQVIQQLIHLEKGNKSMLKAGPYYIFPLNFEEDPFGWIVIGQKTNSTIIDKNELRLLEKIQLDAIELFSNACSFQQIEKKLKKSQETSDLFDHYNTLLLEALEDEKRNLSVFLHDEVLQSLILISNKFQVLSKSKGNNRDIYNDISSLIANSIYEVREMCNDLHPVMVEDLGLEISLQSLKKKIQMNHNVTIHIDYQIPLKILSSTLALQIFRIIKELVNNSIKHASPSYISIKIEEFSDLLTVKVRDNGKGFVVHSKQSNLFNQGSLGLITIEKKVNQLHGMIDIQSQLNKGTSIIINLPVEWSEKYENQGVTVR